MENKEKDLEQVMNELYLKFKVNFYRNLFRNEGLGKDGLTVMENFCAEAIYAMDGPTINQLAAFIRVSQPNAAYKVNNLVKKGYVEKVRSTKDRRQTHLYVTEKFKTHYNINYDYINEITNRLEESMDPDKIGHFQEGLEAMNDGILREVSITMDRNYLNPLLPF
ncbi:MAG: MarR family winged helix-turn-helix transcriptional regulator [Tissierellia bacterium]|nr:MarR family winged helix-turn-helix transcriptional regulator [Tissierellia bacterium]